MKSFRRLSYVEIVIFALFVGSFYFHVMESSIDRDSNCSFASGIMTDVLAFLSGGIIMWRAYRNNDKILFFLGACIIVEHVFQALAHKLETKKYFRD